MGRARRRHDGGMVTAEFAAAMPAVVLVLAMVVGMIQALIAHQRALHGASVGARIAARGEPDSAVRQAVGRSGAGHGAVAVQHRGDVVTVIVTPDLPAAIRWVAVDASVTALREASFEGEP